MMSRMEKNTSNTKLGKDAEDEKETKRNKWKEKKWSNIKTSFRTAVTDCYLTSPSSQLESNIFLAKYLKAFQHLSSQWCCCCTVLWFISLLFFASSLLYTFCISHCTSALQHLAWNSSSCLHQVGTPSSQASKYPSVRWYYLTVYLNPLQLLV